MSDNSILVLDKDKKDGFSKYSGFVTIDNLKTVGKDPFSKPENAIT